MAFSQGDRIDGLLGSLSLLSLLGFHVELKAGKFAGQS